MKQPATKKNIAKRLKRLSVDMLSIAIDMDYHWYGTPQDSHSVELCRASKMVAEWADEITKEVESEVKNES